MLSLLLLVGCALGLGLVCRVFRMPALMGFLAAGFVLNAAGVQASPLLEEVGHTGVLLLLFSVGLKLRWRTLARPEVLGTALGHFALVAGSLSLILLAAASITPPEAIVVAAALAFSSTVLAAKLLEEKREIRAFHGRIALGILIVQDLIAVAILVAFAGAAPSQLALALLALPLLRRPLGWLLDRCGHDELPLLVGVLLAAGLGGYGFELLGLSGELGALLLGLLLADHARAVELGRLLWGVKELFLVAFFLNVGFAGLPTLDALGLALLVLLALPIKFALFVAGLLALGLRARTSFLAALGLASYSEFGLIVVSMAVSAGQLASEWLVSLSLAVLVSFLVAAPLNRLSHVLYARHARWLDAFQRHRRHPDDAAVDPGRARLAVVGMGRVGTGAYEAARSRGVDVVGLDSDPAKVSDHLCVGRHVLFADAEDSGFWQRLNHASLDAVLLAVPGVEARTLSTEHLRASGYRGLIVSTHVYPDEREQLLASGADGTFNYYDNAGIGLADHALELLGRENAGDCDEREPAVSAPPVKRLSG